MSATSCYDFWLGTRIQPRKVSREELGETKIKTSNPQTPDLQPVSIPLDIYLLVLENSSRATLRNFCLVSQLSYHYAAPLLWKDIKLCHDMNVVQFMNVLRDIIKRHGKQVETIDFGFLLDDIDHFDDTEFPRPFEAAINTLVELAVEKMPNLQSFKWGPYQTPSNDLLDALKSRPCLKELHMDSGGWNSNLVIELNLSGFHHLKSFTMDNICEDSQVLAIRYILDSSPGLKNLRLGFIDYYWEFREPETSVEIFDILFSHINLQGEGVTIPGKNLEEFTIIRGFYPELDFGPSFFSAAKLCFKNLDSLTCSYTNGYQMTEQLNQLEDLRLRKLRLKCDAWQGYSPLLKGLTKLELLHIQITAPGFEYDKLIPLICRSGDTLKDLRLEWSNVRKLSEQQETMNKETAWNLASKCSKLSRLSLRADFDLSTWDYIEKAFPPLLIDLTHFKLQRTTPKEKPSQPPWLTNSYASSSAKPPEDAPAAIKQQLSISFLTGLRDGMKHPETAAGDFFAVFITAANNPLGGGELTKLKYVGIDGHVYELHVLGRSFKFSEVPKEKIALCGGPFVPDFKFESQEMLSLSSTD